MSSDGTSIYAVLLNLIFWFTEALSPMIYGHCHQQETLQETSQVPTMAGAEAPWTPFLLIQEFKIQNS